MTLFAIAKVFLHATLLCYLGSGGFGARTCFRFGFFALNARTLCLNLVCQALERRNLGSLLAGRMPYLLGNNFLVFQCSIATGALFFTQLALRLYGSAALSLFGLLFRFFLRLLFR